MLVVIGWLWNLLQCKCRPLVRNRAPRHHYTFSVTWRELKQIPAEMIANVSLSWKYCSVLHLSSGGAHIVWPSYLLSFVSVLLPVVVSWLVSNVWRQWLYSTSVCCCCCCCNWRVFSRSSWSRRIDVGRMRTCPIWCSWPVWKTNKPIKGEAAYTLVRSRRTKNVSRNRLVAADEAAAAAAEMSIRLH